MKKILLVFPVILVAMAPLACNHYYPAGPAPAVTPTPAPITTPVCGFTAVTLPQAITTLPIPVPTWTIISTVVPTPTVTILTGPYPTPTPVTVTTHVPFDGFLIQNLTQWQTYFGSAIPPVNFTTQMVLIYITSMGCPGGQIITSACVTSTEVDLSVTETPGLPCNYIGETAGAIAIPQTSLPLYVTQISISP